MQIKWGDIYWINIGEPPEAISGFSHPYLVVQDDLFNHSRITSLVVCEISTNLKLASLPGNVLLDAGEANLEKQSVVVVSKINTVQKNQLGDYTGTLDAKRVSQVLAGLHFLNSITNH